MNPVLLTLSPDLPMGTFASQCSALLSVEDEVLRHSTMAWRLETASGTAFSTPRLLLLEGLQTEIRRYSQ